MSDAECLRRSFPTATKLDFSDRASPRADLTCDRLRGKSHNFSYWRIPFARKTPYPRPFHTCWWLRSADWTQHSRTPECISSRRRKTFRFPCQQKLSYEEQRVRVIWELYIWPEIMNLSSSLRNDKRWEQRRKNSKSSFFVETLIEIRR